MEQRKLQEVGGGSYTISVPKEWAETQSLSAGSTIHLYPHTDGSIVIRSEKKDTETAAETRIEIDCDDPAITRAELASAHAAGFEAVTLRSDDPFTEDQRRVVKEATRRLVGMEITEIAETEITVRNLLDTTEFSVRQSVVQLQFIVLSALRRATDSVSTADTETVEHLQERADEADRLYNAITRWFDRSLSSFETIDRLGVTRTQFFDYYATANNLVSIVDPTIRIARMAASLSESPPEAVTTAIQEASDTVLSVTKDAATVVLEARYERAHDVLINCKTTRAAIQTAEGHVTDEVPQQSGDRSVFLRMLDALSRIVEAAAAIATISVRSARRASSTD